MGLEDQIEEIEREIAETPYNKASEQHIGRLKARLAELKERLETRGQGTGGGGGYHVAKAGDATVALVGQPSVGKSTLLNAMTNAESDVGSYDFTTLEVHPGMVEYRDAQIQLLDVPGLISGASSGRGRGREVLSMVRAADLLLVLLAPEGIDRYPDIVAELKSNHIRLDRSPPRMTVIEKDRGGIDVTTVSDFSLEEATVEEVVREHGYVNADVHIAEDPDLDRLVDGLMDNRVYLPSVVAVNKVDLVDDASMTELRAGLEKVGIDPDDIVYVSAEQVEGLETLRARLWDVLELRRVYLKKPGEATDYEEPLILTAGETVEDVLERLGGEFESRFRYARVTGPSASHEDQRVGLKHEFEDGDVLTLVLRR